MARIIGGIASSHSPSIGFALDNRKQAEPVWAPIFEAYHPVTKWLEEKRPDSVVLIYNDHVTSFFFDHYSHFTLGIGESYVAADEGGGARALPPIKGNPELAHHIAKALVADEFDLSFFQDRPLDHGCFSPLSMAWPHDTDWPASIVPLQVGVLLFPIPSALRCYKLGLSLRRAIESFPEDLDVVVFATGGLSHQVHGERSGFNNTEWDLQFLDLIENDPIRLTEMTHADYARLCGMEGSEVIMWLIMRAALAAIVKKVHQTYYLPSMVGLTTVIYENPAAEVPADTVAEYRRHVQHQTAGIENLEGTYPFTLEQSVKAYRLNKLLHSLVHSGHRRLFRENPEALFRENRLTEVESAMVRNLDWRAMIHYGVSFFMLEKLGAVVGVPNLHIYAAMRGEPIEIFQKSRNAPNALYSVAGKDNS